MSGLELACQAQAQAYTRLSERQYRFERLDGSGYQATLAIDDERIVIDHPGLFSRVKP
ncbi:MAG: putative glycolipid-binding domain-containing protein [Lautropia sp.]